MPSSTQGTNGTIPKIGSKDITSRGRFELPALAPLGSLTAGTNIPPPLPSPVEESPAPKDLGTSDDNTDLAHTPTKTKDFAQPPSAQAVQNRLVTNNNSAGYIGAFGVRGSHAPVSPTSPTRPGSIRRFFSRNSLHQSYNDSNGSRTPAEQSFRPESPSTFSTISARPSIGSKRSSSWFSRFVGGAEGERASKRASVLYEDTKERPQTPVQRGPPPPQLPKLDQLEAKVTDKSVDFDADDMFRNIS